MAGRLTIIGGGVMGVLAQLAMLRGTVYDIGRFTPAGFADGGVPGDSLCMIR